MNRPPTARADLDIRSLRYFVAVAEELHFTRAAARLFVAQQALSREIQHLERQLGTELFGRTTRRVSLTPAGRDLLGPARELIQLHDKLLAQVAEPSRPVLVDLMSEGRQTGFRVLETARTLAAEVEFRGRHGGGMGSSLSGLQTGELDVAFGRAEWRGQPSLRGIQRSLLRFEPLALLLPADHGLARGPAVRTDDLRGQDIDTNPANPDATEWSDLATQFLDLCGGRATPEHVSAVGLDDQAHHLVQQGLPILTTVDHVDVPGGIVRPIVDPVPIYVWSMVWRAGAHRSGLSALREAAETVARENGWLDLPVDAWLPEPEASTLRRHGT